MTTNLDILVMNEMASMYSENENTYYEECKASMFKEEKEDEN